MKVWRSAALALAIACGGAGAQAQQAASAPVSLAKIAARIPDGARWGRLQIRAGILPCRDYDSLLWNAKYNASVQNEEFERLFREQLAQGGYTVSGDPTNLFESDTKTAEIQVGALLTGIDARFCAQQTLRDRFFENDRIVVNGAATMQVEWQIYSTLQGKVIARIPTTGSYATESAIDGGDIVIMQRAFADNARALAASSQFREALGGASNAAAARRFDELVIRAAPPARRTPAEAANAVAVIFAGSSMGSGFLVSPDGYLLTNSHVVGDAARVRVRWADRTETVGQVLRSDRRRDVALIKVEPTGRKSLPMRAGGANLGEPVYAVGTPLDQKFQGTVTKGVVSAARTYDGLAYIQSDVIVNPGNSGGPLLDEGGAVLGLTVSGYEVNGAPTGLNLFIPIGDALSALALKPAS